MAAGVGFAPILHDIYITGASDIMWRFLSGALFKMSGREQESDEHLAEMINLLDNVDARRHLEVLNWQKIFAHTRGIVSPIGPYCDTISLYSQDRETEIDLPTAEAIRSNGKMKVGDMQKMTVKVDGLIHHNKQLRVYVADNPRPIPAHIRDPAFNDVPNIYTEAVVNQLSILVTAKPTIKPDGTINAIYIMDASPLNGTA